MSLRRNIVLLLMCLSFFLFQGCAVIVAPILYPRKGKIEEILIQEAEGWFVKDKALLVDISGILTSSKNGGLFGSSENVVDTLKEVLKKAEEDPYVKALVLRINSPGGDVTSSDIIYKELKEFRAKTGKIVVAEHMGLATSGAYYISMAADKVYAHPTTLTGNIGVIATFPKLKDLSTKIGIDVRVIKSGDKKDIGSLWRDFSPEEREILESVINEYYERFVTIVAENRKNLDREKVRALADGRIYTAGQALDLGLIDGIAYLSEAIDKARQEAGITDSKVVMYTRPHELKENIYSSSMIPDPASSRQTQIGLVNVNTRGGLLDPGPQFLYLWLP